MGRTGGARLAGHAGILTIMQKMLLFALGVAEFYTNVNGLIMIGAMFGQGLVILLGGIDLSMGVL